MLALGLTSTLSVVSDDMAVDEEAARALPGVALQSGFSFRPSRAVAEARLSEPARERVLAKMKSVDEARLRAAREGQTAYVG